MNLNEFWFLILGVLLTGYAILDGFDLGVGTLHLTVKSDTDRRLLMNSIGPLWDGNEVWLVTFGGALFAAFPDVYATAFSGFYLALMLVLCCLIFRAVSMEFRSKEVWPWWRQFWDVAFCVASTVVTLLFGVAIGNLMIGVPIGADKEFVGNLLTLLRPYPLLVGLLTVSLFAMHGSIYLYLKTEGDLQKRMYGLMWKTFGLFLVMYLLVTIYTLAMVPQATLNFKTSPWAWIVVVLNVLAVANVPRAIFTEKPFQAFLSSCALIAALNFLLGVALFPNLLISNMNPDWSLTIYNASSSPKTLGIMRNIAFMGMPFVLAYTAIIYWVFRGKVQLSKLSY